MENKTICLWEEILVIFQKHLSSYVVFLKEPTKYTFWLPKLCIHTLNGNHYSQIYYIPIIQMLQDKNTITWQLLNSKYYCMPAIKCCQTSQTTSGFKTLFWGAQFNCPLFLHFKPHSWAMPWCLILPHQPLNIGIEGDFKPDFLPPHDWNQKGEQLPFDIINRQLFLSLVSTLCHGQRI